MDSSELPLPPVDYVGLGSKHDALVHTISAKAVSNALQTLLSVLPPVQHLLSVFKQFRQHFGRGDCEDLVVYTSRRLLGDVMLSIQFCILACF
jgi:hypothetical protein